MSDINSTSGAPYSYVPSSFKTFDQLVDDVAEKAPEAVAIVSESRQLSYKELVASSNQFGIFLQNLKLQPEQLVAIGLDRSPELVIATLGTLKAGGAFLPLDPTNSRDTLQHIVEDSKAHFLVTTSALLNLFSNFKGEVILLDKVAAKLESLTSTTPARQHDAHSLAYVIYTSGSTGKPKGAMIEHVGIPNFAHTLGAIMGITSRSRILQFSSFGFDGSLNDIFIALSHGSALIMKPPGSILIGHSLEQVLIDYNVTSLTCTAGVLATMNPGNIGKLEVLVCTGEAASDHLLDVWSERVKLIHAYGPTEVTIMSTITCYSKDKGARNIGKAMPNLKAYILDENLNPVERGTPGELCISGIGVGRGYLNAPEKTAEKFVENKFQTEWEKQHSFGKLYRTGDLCRLNDDESIEYMGRLDSQVEFKGFHIDLHEIEYHLTQHRKVKAAIVMIGDDKQQAKGLYAFVIPCHHTHPHRSKLRNEPAHILKGKHLENLVEHLTTHLNQRHLPKYMIPEHFIFLDHFPVNANGKVDRSQLAALEVHEEIGHKSA